MMYFFYFVIPVLTAATILYLILFVKSKNELFKKVNDEIVESDYYSLQEIDSSQKKYIPIYLSNSMPDYSEYTGEKRRFFYCHVRSNCFEGVDYLLSVFKSNSSEYTRFFILGSAGIGKTTFLLNLYARCVKEIKGSSTVIIPMRINDIENEIKGITTQHSKTILLLDGFDECSRESSEFLMQVLNITFDFRYVVISSRLESFNEVRQYQTPIAKYSGDKGNYLVKSLFIAPFSRTDVKLYLKKIFYRNDFKNLILNRVFGDYLIEEAEMLLDRVKFASLRPLFLYYITDLVKGDFDEYKYDFELYQELLNRWMWRESFDIEDKEAFNDMFLKIMLNIALFMKRKNKKIIDKNDLNEISNCLTDGLCEMSSKCKSLLIKNKHDQFYFYHDSIYQYLLAKEIFETHKDVFSIDLLINNNGDIYEHMLKEMYIKYVFNDNDKIDGCFSLYETGLATIPLSSINSVSDLNNIKYININYSNVSLSVLNLFSNVKNINYENASYEEKNEIKNILLNVNNNL